MGEQFDDGTAALLDSMIAQVEAMGSGMPGSTSGPTFREGPDGQLYRWDTTENRWVVTEGMPSGRPTVSGTRAPEVPYYLRRPDLDFQNVDILAPEAREAFSVGGLNTQDAFLVGQGMGYTPSFLQDLLYGSGGGGGGGSGDAVGWANLAQRQAEFAYAQEQDKIAHAMNQISMYAAQQAREDALAQARQEATLAALPFVAPRGATHMPGFEPDAYGMKSGMLKPMPITRVGFDPNAVSAPASMGETIDAEMAKIAAMAGI